MFEFGYTELNNIPMLSSLHVSTASKVIAPPHLTRSMVHDTYMMVVAPGNQIYQKLRPKYMYLLSHFMQAGDYGVTFNFHIFRVSPNFKTQHVHVTNACSTIRPSPPGVYRSLYLPLPFSLLLLVITYLSPSPTSFQIFPSYAIPSAIPVQ